MQIILEKRRKRDDRVGNQFAHGHADTGSRILGILRRDRRCVTPWNTATGEGEVGEIAYIRSTLTMRIGKGEKLACHRARPLRPLRVVAPLSLHVRAYLSSGIKGPCSYRGVFRILKRNPFCAIGSACSRLTPTSDRTLLFTIDCQPRFSRPMIPEYMKRIFFI